jgi:hypothetical protein
MKKIFLILLIYIGLIANSCHHSKISLGKKHRHVQTEQTSQEEDVAVVDEVEVERAENTEEEEVALSTPKVTIEEKMVTKMDEVLDEETTDKFHSIVSKANRKKNDAETTDDSASEQDQNESDGTGLIVFAAILIGASAALVFFAIRALEDNDSTAEGCLTALFYGVLLIILAVFLGIAGVLFLIMGISKAVGE